MTSLLWLLLAPPLPTEPISFTAPIEPIDEVVARLADEIDVPLRVHSDLQERYVFASVRDVPSDDLLRAVALAVDAEWKAYESGYQLNPAEPSDNKLLEIARANLEELRNRAERPAWTTEAELRPLILDLVDAEGADNHQLQRELRRDLGSMRLSDLVLLSLEAEDFLSIAIGDSVTFAANGSGSIRPWPAQLREAALEQKQRSETLDRIHAEIAGQSSHLYTFQGIELQKDSLSIARTGELDFQVHLLRENGYSRTGFNLGVNRIHDSPFKQEMEKLDFSRHKPSPEALAAQALFGNPRKTALMGDWSSHLSLARTTLQRDATGLFHANLRDVLFAVTEETGKGFVTAVPDLAAHFAITTGNEEMLNVRAFANAFRPHSSPTGSITVLTDNFGLFSFSFLPELHQTLQPRLDLEFYFELAELSGDELSFSRNLNIYEDVLRNLGNDLSVHIPYFYDRTFDVLRIFSALGGREKTLAENEMITVPYARLDTPSQSSLKSMLLVSGLREQASSQQRFAHIDPVFNTSWSGKRFPASAIREEDFRRHGQVHFAITRSEPGWLYGRSDDVTRWASEDAVVGRLAQMDENARLRRGTLTTLHFQFTVGEFAGTIFRLELPVPDRDAELMSISDLPDDVQALLTERRARNQESQFSHRRSGSNKEPVSAP